MRMLKKTLISAISVTAILAVMVSGVTASAHHGGRHHRAQRSYTCSYCDGTGTDCTYCDGTGTCYTSTRSGHGCHR